MKFPKKSELQFRCWVEVNIVNESLLLASPLVFDDALLLLFTQGFP